jgi:hypothetical protein
MNQRKGTPDIMGNLMSGILEKQESSKTIKLESHKEIIIASNKAIKESAKEKTTFNLSIEAIESLEEAWIKLRRKLKGNQRVTKTLIVEKAIEIALKDLETKKEASELYLSLQAL